MSVKPIQDDLQVSEVGETPKVNKTSIDSQLLTLPPMTMGDFQDLVQSVVEDITKPDAPQTISINEIIPSNPASTITEIAPSIPSNVNEANVNFPTNNFAPVSSLEIPTTSISTPETPEVPEVPKTPEAPVANVATQESPEVDIETPKTPEVDVTTPEVSEVSAPTPEAPVANVETPVATTKIPEVDLKETLNNISDLESRALDLISQMEAKLAGTGASQEASGLTTRDYVDQVLGGERNLEGQNLVNVANFLSNEHDKGLTFTRNEEGLIEVRDNGELIDTMTETEANAWISEIEKNEGSKNDEHSTQAVAKTDANDPEDRVKVISQEDVATADHKPFAFDSPNLLFISDGVASMQMVDLFEELNKAILQHNKTKNYFLLKFDLNTSGAITDSEVVFTNKNGNDTIPEGLEELVEFETVGDRKVQTAIYFPFAIGFQGQIQMLTTGGFYRLFQYCVNIDGEQETALFPHKLI